MKFEFSAGGIVYKTTAGSTQTLVSQHSFHHGWVFPKGLIGDSVKNEKKEDTAVREVEEETGAIGRIVNALAPVTYWYSMDGQKVKKTIYYFLMEYIAGDITKHDHEMENVEWLPIDEVEHRLTYKSDKNVWKEAKTMLG